MEGFLSCEDVIVVFTGAAVFLGFWVEREDKVLLIAVPLVGLN